MGKPTVFPEVNGEWRGWPAGETHAEGGDLPTYTDEDTATIISCWQIGWWERLRILLTGHVWLHVLNTVHPPVHVGGDYPFKRGAGYAEKEC